MFAGARQPDSGRSKRRSLPNYLKSVRFVVNRLLRNHWRSYCQCQSLPVPKTPTTFQCKSGPKVRLAPTASSHSGRSTLLGAAVPGCKRQSVASLHLCVGSHAGHAVRQGSQGSACALPGHQHAPLVEARVWGASRLPQPIRLSVPALLQGYRGRQAGSPWRWRQPVAILVRWQSACPAN